MDNQMMTLEQIEAELARREALASNTNEALATGDLLTVGLALFQANPERILTESASFARLLELDAARRLAPPPVPKTLADLDSGQLKTFVATSVIEALLEFVSENRQVEVRTKVLALLG